MIVELINRGYLVIFLLNLFLIIIIVYYIHHILHHRIDYEKTKYADGKKEKYQGRVRKIIRRETLMWNIVFLLFGIIFIGGYIKYNFRIEDDFAREIGNKENIDKLFLEEERETYFFEENMQSILRENLVLTLNKGIIDEKILSEYERNIRGIYGIVPFCTDIENGENAPELFEENVTIFSEYVGKDKKDISSVELWNAYLAGEEVIKVNYTSENVFQMAVLAEAAQANEYKNPLPSDKTEEYMLGAIAKFEEFLTFVHRNAGSGVIVEADEVCFRVGKMLYRESKNSNLNDPQKKLHYMLWAYSCFQFSVNQINQSNNNYLCYLYYYGESTLDILNYVEDSKLCITICNEQIDLWDKLDDDYFIEHRVETKSTENVRVIAERLKQYKEQVEN